MGSRSWTRTQDRLPEPNLHVITSDGVFVEIGMWESDYINDYVPLMGDTALCSLPTHWMNTPRLPDDD